MKQKTENVDGMKDGSEKWDRNKISLWYHEFLMCCYRCSRPLSPRYAFILVKQQYTTGCMDMHILCVCVCDCYCCLRSYYHLRIQFIVLLCGMAIHLFTISVQFLDNLPSAHMHYMLACRLLLAVISLSLYLH